MGRAIAAIAVQVLVEAVRSRLVWVLAVLTVLAAGLARFAGALALTEAVHTEAALGGALLRVVAVLLTAGFVVTSIARERADQGQQMVLALGLPRAAWLLGKLAGFGLAALLPVLLFGLLALSVTAPGAALAWSVTLLFELWIVAAFALLCANGLAQPLAALAATLAFYLLARCIDGLAALAHQHGRAGSVVLDALDALLPQLDRFASSDWLAYADAGVTRLAPLLLQTVISVLLLTSAALVDLYRKEL